MRPPRWALALLVGAMAAGCGRSGGDYRSFVRAHDAMKPGMTIEEVFAAGLADYLEEVGIKQVHGHRLSAADIIETPSAVVEGARISYGYPPDTDQFKLVLTYCDGREEYFEYADRDSLLSGLDVMDTPFATLMTIQVRSPLMEEFSILFDTSARIESVTPSTHRPGPSYDKKDQIEAWQAFERARAAAQPGMTFREVLAAGLADYIERPPAGSMFVGGGRRSFADRLLPGPAVARSVTIEHGSGYGIKTTYFDGVSRDLRIADREELISTLRERGPEFAAGMEFRIESPPLQAFGVYEHFVFTFNTSARLLSVSPIRK